MSNHMQSPGGQFRPVIPPQQGQPLIPSQHFQQFPPRQSHPGYAAPSSQTMPMSYVQTRPLTSGLPQAHQNAHTFPNQMSGLGAPGIPLSSAYAYAPSSFSQAPNNVSSTFHFQQMSQMHVPVMPTSGQPWQFSGSQTTTHITTVDQGSQQSSVTPTDSTVNVTSLSQPSTSDWQEHTSADGRRYYHNTRTKQSSWEKPLELMTPLERADASTVWKEFTSPGGRKYYYNKVTRESKWTIPEELKLAREQAQREASQGIQPDAIVASHANAAYGVSSAETPMANSSASRSMLSPVPVTLVGTVSNSPSVVVSGSSAVLGMQTASTSVVGVQSAAITTVAQPEAGPGITGGPASSVAANSSSTSSIERVASQEVINHVDGSSSQDIEEARKGMAVAGKVYVTPSEGKGVDDEPLVFATKLEAKNAFKALLESVNVQSDWTWEQTMREIINDKRYGTLKTLGERKQAFNEYLGQRKKLEAEERRMRQKRAREEFTKMLEESEDLMSSIRWSKAVSMFENDERFKAVERTRDREDLFESYTVELQRKEKERASEEHKRSIAEYRKYLETCDFIKVNSQWRKVQDRLEDDERCSRLEKLDRLLIFQDFIRDLEKEEEEQKIIQKELMRRVERKNRDEFRKLIEEHVAEGVLTAKANWCDFYMKIKDLPQYQAVASNTSGSTPKDLFEDVSEGLEKQYHEDKSLVKDAMKSQKISMASTWTFEDFKATIEEEAGPLPISSINFKLVYEELLERAKEKEEKEAKKRQRIADDFSKLLHSLKEITATSIWEDSKQFFEESEEYRLITEESFGREIFEEHIAYLQEKAKEKARKRDEEKAKKEKEREEKEKRKEKERKERDRGEKEKEKDRGEKEKEKGKDRSKKDDSDSDTMDVSESQELKEDKKREKDRDRKHRKRHQSTTEEASSDKEEKEDYKKSRKHGSDRKRSRKHAYSPESDNESRHRKHRRDHRDVSKRNGGYGELEDGEVGEDGEIQ